MKTNFLGEYECKLDDKGRLKLPSAILNQLGESSSHDFVANRGLERCLHLFPREVFDAKISVIQGLNEYLPEVRDFRRVLLRGATALIPDKTNRILLPRILLEYAGIDRTLFITTMGDYLEMWSPENYRNMISKEPENLSALAEKIAHLGTKGSNE